MDDVQSDLVELIRLTLKFWVIFGVVLSVAKLWPTSRDFMREVIISLQVWVLVRLPRHALAGESPFIVRAMLNPHGGSAGSTLTSSHLLRVAEKEVDMLRGACGQLGISHVGNGRIFRALFLRTSQHNYRANWIIFGLLGSLVWVPRVGRILWEVGSGVMQRGRGTGYGVSIVTDVASRVTAASDVEITSMLCNFVAGILMVWVGFVVLFLLLGWPFVIVLAALSGRNVVGVQFRSAVVRRRYGLVASVAEAIRACANAYNANDFDRPDALRNLSERLVVVERNVLRAHNTSGVLGRRSPIRKMSRSHGRDVAARLRAAESDVLTGGVLSNAVPGLAKLLIDIADRYLMGDVCRLLDERDVVHPNASSLGPVRDYEPFRGLSFAILWLAAVVGIGRFGLSDGAEVAAIGAAAMIAATLVYKRRWLSALQRLPITLN
ncbi:hypothetical protein [Streptomyces mayonensis]|uniref:hypothetical protein n=1 Tax=Streptomyces mayonensis TaxID=2750816 RepID=UPI001C1DF729|nr:hypothetical protein [Streptomyces sp. A108]MBU6536036.1 hypothetical protein [Streptomyces sp. A108]